MTTILEPITTSKYSSSLIKVWAVVLTNGRRLMHQDYEGKIVPLVDRLQEGGHSIESVQLISIDASYFEALPVSQ